MKKKLVILFLFLCIALVGCSDSQRLDITPNITDFTNTDYSQDKSNIYTYFQNFNLVKDTYEDTLDKGVLDNKAFNPSYDDFYTRNQILLENRFKSNYSINHRKSTNFLDYTLNQSFYIITGCEIDNTCVGMYENYSGLMDNFDYGINEEGGFYSFVLLNSENEISNYESMRFVVKDDQMSAEYLYLFNNLERMEYIVFNSNEYRKYGYSEEGRVTFEYSNLSTYDYVYYTFDDDNYFLLNYNHEDQILFEAGDTYTSVTKYDDFTPVATLSSNDDVHMLTIHFKYMDGWDEIYFNNLYENFGPTNPEYTYSMLYNDDVEVFGEYDVMAKSDELYFKIYFEIVIEDLDDYSFPEAFTGDITYNELKQNLNNLDDYTYMFQINGLTQDDVEHQVIDLYNEFCQRAMEVN